MPLLGESQTPLQQSAVDHTQALTWGQPENIVCRIFFWNWPKKQGQQWIDLGSLEVLFGVLIFYLLVIIDDPSDVLSLL